MTVVPSLSHHDVRAAPSWHPLLTGGIDVLASTEKVSLFLISHGPGALPFVQFLGVEFPLMYLFLDIVCYVMPDARQQSGT